MESDKTLAAQCIEGQGVVQVSVQVKIMRDNEKRINIVDVLKPAENYVELEETNCMFEYRLFLQIKIRRFSRLSK